MGRKIVTGSKAGVIALWACSLMLLLVGMIPSYGGTMLDRKSDAPVASGVT